ncbi:MAG: hypothetical protein IT246_03080 [Bacteroidia bacterium]|nr:hypothetical protein [Bacteroidia bacterium]MCZ2139772.1 hypothetical protein [Bacteroidia bacterium]
MLRKIVLFCIVLGLSFTLFAQRIVVNPEPTREANVLHAKRIWRVIDLREKKNVTAKWPRNPISNVLYNAALSGKLRPYRNDSLNKWYDLEEFVAIGADTFFVKKLIDPNDEDFYTIDTVVDHFKPDEKINLLLLMEDVYFDSKTSREYSQITAIAPLYNKTVSNIDLGLLPLCWFKYYDRKNLESDCRQIFVNSLMYNSGNPYQKFSYMDWFEQRLFTSVIIKESNPYDLFIMDDPEVKRNGINALIKAANVNEQKGNREEDYYER